MGKKDSRQGSEVTKELEQILLSVSAYLCASSLASASRTAATAGSRLNKGKLQKALEQYCHSFQYL